MSFTINRVTNFEIVSQDINGKVLDTTDTGVLNIKPVNVENVNLDDMFADFHNTFNPDNKGSIPSSLPTNNMFSYSSRATTNGISNSSFSISSTNQENPKFQVSTVNAMQGDSRYQVPIQDYSSKTTTSGVSNLSTATAGVASPFTAESLSNNGGMSVDAAGVGVLSSTSIGGDISINNQSSSDNYHYGESAIYDTTNMVLTPNGTLSVAGIDLTQLTEEDFEALIGSMNQEEYNSFIKGIEDYYQVQIDFCSDLLEKEDSNGNKGLNEQLDEVNKVVTIIESSANANARYGAKENPSTVAAIFKEKLESVNVSSYEELKAKQRELQNTVNSLNEYVKMMKNVRDSAKYDYLKYLSAYNDYESHEFTQEEWDSFEDSKSTVVDVYQTKLTSYSYTLYHKKHPEVSPIEYLQMIKMKDPNGNYTISGIDNLEDLKALIEVSDKVPNMAKTYNYLYHQDSKKAEQFLKDCKYEINNIRGQLEAKQFLEVLAEKNDEEKWKLIGEWLSNEFGVHIEGTADGVISFFRGLYYTGEAAVTGSQELLSALGLYHGEIYENRTMSVSEYKTMYIMQALMSKKDKEALGLINEDGSLVDPNSIIDFSKEYVGTMLSYNYEISQGIGNMIPSMMLSAVNPALGSVAMGVSAGGNAYHGAMVDGNSYLSSLMYGIFNGTSEAITERFLGGIPGLGDIQVTGLKTWLQAMRKEGTQEMVQAVMDAFWKFSFMGEKVPSTEDEWAAFFFDIGKQGLYGAITAGYMNVPGVVNGTLTIHKFNEYMKANNISDAEQRAAIDAIKKSNPELAKMADEQIKVQFGMNILAQIDLQRIQTSLGCDADTAFAIMQNKLSSADAIKLVELVKSGTSIEEALAQLEENATNISPQKESTEHDTSTKEAKDSELKNLSDNIIKSEYPDIFTKQLIINKKISSLGINDEIAKIMVKNNTSKEIATYMYENNIKSMDEIAQLASLQSENNNMNLFQKILNCKEEEIDSLIEQAIKDSDSNAEKVDSLGFLDYRKFYSLFKGFIPLKTRIKYANLSIEDYGMETTDYIYEFAHFIREHKINNKASLIYNLEYFVNSYFGFSGKANRETIFYDIAFQNTTTDEEFWKAIDNNKLGDLKKKGAAQCTERSALVQQILSVFGIESYYSIGCVDLGDRQEAHCFNIVKRKNDYALLDYSIPIASYNEDGSFRAYYPFIGTLTNEEFLDFVSNGTIKTFDEYYMKGKQKEKTGNQRKYVVGKYEI